MIYDIVHRIRHNEKAPEPDYSQSRFSAVGVLAKRYFPDVLALAICSASGIAGGESLYRKRFRKDPSKLQQLAIRILSYGTALSLLDLTHKVFIKHSGVTKQT